VLKLEKLKSQTKRKGQWCPAPRFKCAVPLPWRALPCKMCPSLVIFAPLLLNPAGRPDEHSSHCGQRFVAEQTK